MENYEGLKRRIQTESLAPDPGHPGEFIKRYNGNGQDGIGFLQPNTWVFHPQVVESVLTGDYEGIMPFSAEFVTTLNCSNRCEFCGYRNVKMLELNWIRNNFKDPEVHMQDINYAKTLLGKLIDGGVRGLIFTGGGEPSSFSHLDELVAYTTQREADSVVYTNGNSIPPERARKIARANPLLVRVSLNAGTPEVYNAMHNPLNPVGALERCLQTIEVLAQEAKKSYSKMSVGIGVVIDEKNQDDLENTALRIREIADRTKGGIEFVAYRPVFEYYETAEQLPVALLDKTHAIVEDRVRKILDGTGVKVSNVTCRYEALKHNTRNYEICRTTGLIAELGPNGNLHLCCDRNLNRRFVIGNLNTQSLEEVWNSELRKYILNYINSGKCKMCPPGCKSHETNIQFQKIEELRSQGEIERARLWIEEQQKMKKPKMWNF